MKALVSALLFADTQSDATTIANRIMTFVDKLTIPVVDEGPNVLLYHDGRWAVQTLIRCITQAEADTFYTDVVGGWTTGPIATRVKTGSSAKRTNNYDDEAAGQPDYILYSLTK